MKKKIFALVAMVIVLSFVLAGCNLFVTNAQRDAHQVVATVEYKDKDAGIDISADISKSEYAEFFAQNYSTYNYYYGFTAEECADMFINILAKQKMLVMLASVEFTDDASNVPSLKFDVTTGQYDYETYAKALVSILALDEQKYVKEQTNKIFEDEFKSIVDDLIEKQKLIDDLDKEKEEDDDMLKPRPQMPEKEPAPFKKDDSVTIEDVNAEVDFFTAKALEENPTEYEKDALKEIEESLELQYKSYYYYLAKQAESQLTTKYTEANSDYDKNIVDVLTEYTTIIESETQLYADSAQYKTAIEADAGDILVHNGQYIKVKSILLKFSAEQEALLATLNEKFPSEKYSDYIIDLREAMIFGNVEELDELLEEMPIPVQDELLGLTVNVSNLDYKPGSDIEDAYDKTEVPFLEVIADMGRAISQAEVDAKAEYAETYLDADLNDTSYSAGQKMFIAEKRLDEFEKWMYMVNDDEGMFQGTDYTETPLEQDSSFVPEYTALVRQLLLDQATAGANMINAAGGDSMVSAKDGYTETITVEGEEVEVVHTATGNIVTTTSKLRGDEIVIYTDTTNNMSFIINDFGVHIVMLTNVTIESYNKDLFTAVENPDFDLDKYNAEGGYSESEINLIKEANMIYIMGIDAFVGFDDETGKATTVFDKFEEQLNSTYEADEYSKFEKSLFDRYGENLYDESDDEEAEGVSNFTFTRDDGLFNSMKKQYIQDEKDYLASQK